MRFPTMFSPIQIGSVTVPNRFVVPPMANNFSDPDGCLSQRSLAYYAARARGGFGLITIESAEGLSLCRPHHRQLPPGGGGLPQLWG